MPAKKTEFFGGPLDGSRLQCQEDVAWFASCQKDLLHLYWRNNRGMEWEGLVDREGVNPDAIYVLTVGERGR